LSSSQ
jgi:predicted RNase H-like nuclease (RuvC/YqgF family)